jgi:streptogramin lyase
VYAKAPGWSWHALSGGEAVPVETPAERDPGRPVDTFPDGTRFTDVDVHNRAMSILDRGASLPRRVAFDYQSPGPRIFSMTAGPDGRIYGATGLPLRIWRFDPASGEMKNWGLGRHGGHANQFVRQGDKLYAAVYSSGSLIELDPSKPVDDAPIEKSTNPRQVHGYKYGFNGDPDMFGRPHALLAHPDGTHVVLGGNPARARVGGGLLIYNVKTGEEAVLKPDELVPDQGVHAIGALPGGDLIIGTTTSAATGGSATATAALLYRLDWLSRKVTGRWTLEPATPAVHDFVVAADGKVYGLAEPDRLFVFDPAKGAFVHDEVLSGYGRLTGSQAPRTMAVGPDGAIYALFDRAIVRLEPDTLKHREIARLDRDITAGILIHDNRLYFASVSRLFSYDLGQQ